MPLIVNQIIVQTTTLTLTPGDSDNNTLKTRSGRETGEKTAEDN